jgi:hypothetical protein
MAAVKSGVHSNVSLGLFLVCRKIAGDRRRPLKPLEMAAPSPRKVFASLLGISFQDSIQTMITLTEL